MTLGCLSLEMVATAQARGGIRDDPEIVAGSGEGWFEEKEKQGEAGDGLTRMALTSIIHGNSLAKEAGEKQYEEEEDVHTGKALTSKLCGRLLA